MINVLIDYQNLQFMVFDNGQLQDNLLLVEVQQAVILQVIEHCVEILSCLLEEQTCSDPDVLRQALVY